MAILQLSSTFAHHFVDKCQFFHVLSTFHTHFVDTQDIGTLYNMSRCQLTKQDYTTYMLLRFANDMLAVYLK